MSLLGDLFRGIGYVLKYSIVALAFCLKWVVWYIDNSIKVIKGYPRSSKSKIVLKEEVL